MSVMLLNSFISFPDSGGFTDPTDISNLVFWYDANDVNSGAEPTNGTNISSWQDKGPNGYDLSQGTGTAQPVYRTGILNGKPAIDFEGNDFMDNTMTSGISQPNTWVLVVQPQTGWDYIFDGRTTRQLMDDNAGLLRMFAGVGTADTALNPTEGSNYMLFSFFDGASSYLRYNKTDDSAVNPGTNGLDDLRLGSRQDNTGHFIGYIYQVLLYDKTLTATEISNLESYFENLYGTFQGITMRFYLKLTDIEVSAMMQHGISELFNGTPTKFSIYTGYITDQNTGDKYWCVENVSYEKIGVGLVNYDVISWVRTNYPGLTEYSEDFVNQFIDNSEV